MYSIKVNIILFIISEITVAWGKLLGVFTRQNIPDAAAVFQKYANEGMPDAQMGLGFLYATGKKILHDYIKHQN